jgi:DedD protein
MAFFKFRTGAHDGSEENDSGSETRSVENLRRQARQRLVGAAILVVLAVAGFPLVFDTQPRPVPSDLAIDIPSKSKQAPEQPPAPLAADSGDASVGTATRAETHPSESPDTKQSLSDKEELVTSAAKTPAQEPAALAKTQPSKETDKEPAKTEPAKVPNDKPEVSEPRYVVQVGSYAEEPKVRETRAKLEKAGLKTYTQVAEGKDGKRTRVRLGPFASKAEAEKAAEKAKSLQLPALILTF